MRHQKHSQCQSKGLAPKLSIHFSYVAVLAIVTRIFSIC